MERARDSNNIACNTRELREIAREAHRRGLNRQMKPAQFKLLDPKGIHILSPRFMHDKADGKYVEPHLRMYLHMKLIGKQKAIELMIDVPFKFVRGYIEDPQEWLDLGMAQGSMGTDEEGKANLQAHMEALGAINVSMVVGSDTDEPLNGLVLNPEQTHIIGVLPGTDAYKMGMEKASEITGIPIDRDGANSREEIFKMGDELLANVTNRYNLTDELVDEIIRKGERYDLVPAPEEGYSYPTDTPEGRLGLANDIINFCLIARNKDNITGNDKDPVIRRHGLQIMDVLNTAMPGGKTRKMGKG
jgi:hypothetical protein